MDIGGINTTEICNLSCIMCPFHGANAPNKKAQTINCVFVEKFLQHIKPNSDIWFSGLGEFFMDPNALTYLRMARDYELKPCILTNGNLFTKALIDEVLYAGVRTIRISVDDINEQGYESIRRKGDFGVVIEACRYLRSKKKDFPDLRVGINATLLNHTFHKRDEMVEFWKGKVDSLDLNAEYYDIFKFRNLFFKPSKRVDCKIALYLLPSGQISPCCAVTVYQNYKDVPWLLHISEVSLKEAYDYLCNLYKDESSPLRNLCRDCQWWIMFANEGESGQTPYLQSISFDDLDDSLQYKQSCRNELAEGLT